MHACSQKAWEDKTVNIVSKEKAVREGEGSVGHMCQQEINNQDLKAWEASHSAHGSDREVLSYPGPASVLNRPCEHGLPSFPWQRKQMCICGSSGAGESFLLLLQQ